MSVSKSMGTKGESKVSKYVNDHGLFAERRALAGSKDKGDLRVITADGTELTVEVKAGKQTMGYSRNLLHDWKEQTMVEGENAGCKPVLVLVKPYNRMKNQEVWIPNKIWYDGVPGWTMMYLDDFVELIGGTR